MYMGSDKKNKLTLKNDPRVTGIGRFLRKYKIDELPQLFNVLKGDMSFVGPRPEVSEFVEHISITDREIIYSIQPGITDFSSVIFIDESQLLHDDTNYKDVYIKRILPNKVRLSKIYRRNKSIKLDIYIILKTLCHILKH